ncbi:hypothetical protein BC829DRAFT_41846 [Chytridium lagenaria]|nr:hypothetical protein BC829DRAFT_41846 [Chytridium lagenaria]
MCVRVDFEILSILFCFCFVFCFAFFFLFCLHAMSACVPSASYSLFCMLLFFCAFFFGKKRFFLAGEDAGFECVYFFFVECFSLVLVKNIFIISIYFLSHHLL